jgi:transposase
MKALSMDLRERIVRAMASGQPMQTTARRFDGSPKTLQRLIAPQQHGGSIAPRPIPDIPRHIDAEGVRQVQERLAAEPDATVLENCAWWAEVSGQQVSEATMWQAIHRLGWMHKKAAHKAALRGGCPGTRTLNLAIKSRLLCH